jgi:histidine phosphotransferase ChpT
MDDLLDFQVTELPCSRLCHELASPVGAINNGIEMIEEFDESMLPDAMPLIGSSARLVADRLKFYRMAYGRAGTRSVSSDSDIRDLAEAYLSDGRSTLDWPAPPAMAQYPDGWGKLLLNLVPLATETLPRGGAIRFRFADLGGKFRIAVECEGKGARIPEECLAALSPDVAIDALTPRSVHAYFLSRLARRMGSEVVVEAAKEDVLTLSMTLSR